MRGAIGLALLAAALVAVPGRGAEPKAEADKPFDTMKEMFNGQKDMFQGHLNTISAILVAVTSTHYRLEKPLRCDNRGVARPFGSTQLNFTHPDVSPVAMAVVAKNVNLP